MDKYYFAGKEECSYCSCKDLLYPLKCCECTKWSYGCMKCFGKAKSFVSKQMCKSCNRDKKINEIENATTENAIYKQRRIR